MEENEWKSKMYGGAGDNLGAQFKQEKKFEILLGKTQRRYYTLSFALQKDKNFFIIYTLKKYIYLERNFGSS